MDAELFGEFLESNDSLRIYEDGELTFSSTSDRLMPLLEFIDRFGCLHQNLVVLDKIMGNAAALLSVKVGCTEAWSPLGSEPAARTFLHYTVKYHFSETVPLIRQPGGEECPMERLSRGKEPEEFYRALGKMISGSQ